MKAIVDSRSAPARRAEPFFWAALLLVVRAAFLPLTEQDIDGANFARAVERIDLAAWAPHPPGYPVLVGAAKAIRVLASCSPERALALTALLASTVLATSVFIVLERVWGRSVARLSMILLVASPLLSLFAVRPLSDGPGAALAWAITACAIVLAERPPRSQDLLPAVVLGLFALLCGLRLSALPFALPAVSLTLRLARRRSIPIVAFGLTMFAFLVPFVAAVDPSALVHRTSAHARGHFFEYGGSVLAAQSSAVERVIGLVRALFAHGLGGTWAGRPWTTLLVSLALCLAAPFLGSARRRAARGPGAILCSCAGLYLVWALFGQNIVEQPRHILPLVPALIGFVAAASLAAFRARAYQHYARVLRRGLLVAGLIAGLYESLRLATIQARYPAPIVRLARYASEQPDASTLTIATYRFYRWIAWRAPSVRVESVGDLEAALALCRSRPGRVLVTSEVAGAERLPLSSVLMRATTDPFVRFVFEDVRLLDLSEAEGCVQHGK